MDTVQDEEDSSQHLGNELLDGDADYDEIEPGAPDITSAVTEQKNQASQNKAGKGNL